MYYNADDDVNQCWWWCWWWRWRWRWRWWWWWFMMMMMIHDDDDDDDAVDVEEEEDDDVEGYRSQDQEAHFVRACAVLSLPTVRTPSVWPQLSGRKPMDPEGRSSISPPVETKWPYRAERAPTNQALEWFSQAPAWTGVVNMIIALAKHKAKNLILVSTSRGCQSTKSYIVLLRVESQRRVAIALTVENACAAGNKGCMWSGHCKLPVTLPECSNKEMKHVEN